MTTPLTPEEYTKYAGVIDGILSTADLATVSRKMIRKNLETLFGKDLDDQKIAISNLIIERFDAVSTNSPSKPEESSPKKRPAANANGASHDSAPSGPSRKKAKQSSSEEEDADARLAAELQAQENSLARARSTRGGSSSDKKVVKKKKAMRKKSSANANDDSDADNKSGSEKPKRKAGGGFQKPFMLSPALSELTGETQLSRPGVVKSLWAHIKANDLQDPSDKRQILCDDKMQAIFKQPRVDMFRMNKEISNHLYPIDEAA